MGEVQELMGWNKANDIWKSDWVSHRKKERTGFRTATSIDSLTFQMKEPKNPSPGGRVTNRACPWRSCRKQEPLPAKQPLLRGNIAGKLQAGHAHKAWIS